MKLITKPWGKEEILEHNEKYVLKKLTMRKGHKCSIQYHEKKIETMYLLSGKMRVFIGDKVDDLSAHDMCEHEFLTLSPLKVHRMEAIEDSVYLEASTPELDDVVRLVDEYGRA